MQLFRLIFVPLELLKCPRAIFNVLPVAFDLLLERLALFAVHPLVILTLLVIKVKVLLEVIFDVLLLLNLFLLALDPVLVKVLHVGQFVTLRC